MKRIVLLGWVLLMYATQGMGQQLVSTTAISGIKGIHHVSLSVRNLDRAVAYYAQTIGLTEVSRYRLTDKMLGGQKGGVKSVARNVALLRGPNGQLELNQFDGAANQPVSGMPVQGPGITHVCYQAPAASALYARTKALGGSIVSRGAVPVDRGYGIQYAYAKDPDGIMYELEQLEKPPFADSVWVGHVALVTPDIDRLVAFYTKLLGVPPHNRIDNIRNSPKLDDIANIDSLKLRAAWFRTGNMTVEMWQFDNPPTTTPGRPISLTKIGYTSISFEVSNINQTYLRLRNAGMTFLSPSVAKKVTVSLHDPDGNLLNLVELSANAPTSIDRLKRLN